MGQTETKVYIQFPLYHSLCNIYLRFLVRILDLAPPSSTLRFFFPFYTSKNLHLLVFFLLGWTKFLLPWSYLVTK